VIGVWSLLLSFVWSPLSDGVLRLTGAEPSGVWQWTVAFGATFVVLLPATAAMGATLPALERLVSGSRSDARSITLLYASNTAGAVLGVLATALWLIPALGLRRSAAVCIALNLLCAMVALRFSARAEPLPAPTSGAPEAKARSALVRLALTGFLGVGYEVLVVRVLSQVTEDTVYTFALLLAVYLTGTAVGAALYRRFFESRRGAGKLQDRLLAAVAVACSIGSACLFLAERIKDWALDALGSGLSAALAAEALLALVAFGLPTLVMGALFCHLCRSAQRAGVSFGRAFGVNLLAAAVAPALLGVVVVPAIGPKPALLLVILGYLALATRRSWLEPFVWLPAAGALGFAWLTPPLQFVAVPRGGHVVTYREGVMAAVSVVEDADGVARLFINNRQQEGSSASLRVDARQAVLPLLLHSEPRRALFLGLGTGVTAMSAAADPTLQVEAVELLPEVIAASRRFVTDESARLHVVAADARRYVRATEQLYDVIVSDNFHPARSGSGALYTVEHFTAVQARLAPGGVFCQWLPLHQLDLGSLRSIVGSFLTAYPHAWGMLASNSLETPVLGLIGRADERRFDVAALHERLAHLARPEWLTGLALEDELAVLGSFAMGPAALKRFSSGAPLNTDDHPVVAYSAPRITYAPDSSPRDRLIGLLRELSVEPDELIEPPADPKWSSRLAAYWLARDRYVESGRDVRPSSRVEEMLAQVREPLLDVLRISPDFRPAYDPLLGMAQALARSDVSSARQLLAELAALQPTRTEAASALSLIGH
jgi:spermidine synthase